jgi:O-antigen/teichoic acid export membrane protein
LAERLTLQPLTRLATTIQRVSFPTFSSIQNDNAQLRSGYLRSVQGLILAMGPVIAGVFVFAPEIAKLLNKTPMLPVLRLLAAATMLKIVGTMVGSMFMAKGKANWSFYWYFQHERTDPRDVFLRPAARRRRCRRGCSRLFAALPTAFATLGQPPD